jgi:hypothetical protein
MSLVSFITGGMTVIMAYAFYSVGIDDVEEELGVEDKVLRITPLQLMRVFY